MPHRLVLLLDFPPLFPVDCTLPAVLMLALQNNPQFRFYPLPAIFNFRRNTVHPKTGPPLPVLLHAHIFSRKQANVERYKDVAKHSALLMMEDCLFYMRQQGAPYHFLCDMLTG